MASDSDSDCPPLDLENEEQEVTTISTQQIQFSIWDTFKHHIPRFLITMIVDVILPFVIYLLLQKRTNSVNALLAAGFPPLIMVIIKGVVARTFDALGFLVFIAFAASAVAAIITGNATIILLEKSLVTGLISIIFGITLIPLRCCHHRCQIRPLAYYFYQDLVPTKRAQVGLPDIIFEDDEILDIQDESLIPKLTHKQEVAQVYAWIYAHCSSFRFSCYMITSIWAVGLLLEFLARLCLILLGLKTQLIVIYSHVILSLITSLLILLTILCITRERKETLKLIQKWKLRYLDIHQERSDMSSSSISDNINLNIVI